MKPGDLIQVMKDVNLYDEWMNLDTRGSAVRLGSIGIILESYTPAGGNGCKVLLNNGASGWIGIWGLEVIG